MSSRDGVQKTLVSARTAERLEIRRRRQKGDTPLLYEGCYATAVNAAFE
jgi:hypothetical protein